MAKQRAVKQMYQRIFFDYLLMVGVIFLALSYIMRATWLGAFTEAMAIIVGIMWSYRAINTMDALTRLTAGDPWLHELSQ